MEPRYVRFYLDLVPSPDEDHPDFVSDQMDKLNALAEKGYRVIAVYPHPSPGDYWGDVLWLELQQEEV